MTLTDIANIALEDLGGKPISSIDGDDFDAQRLKRRIKSTIDDVAAMRKWTCLRRTVILPMSAKGDFENRFLLPNGLVEIIMVNPYCQWRIEGRELVSTAQEMEILCTVISYNPNDWNVHFKAAVLAKFGADIAFMVTSNAQLAAQKKQLAQMEVAQCISRDFYAEMPRQEQTGITWWNEV